MINVANRFVPNLSGRSERAPRPARAATQGVKDAAKALGLDLKRDPAVETALGGPPQRTVFDGAGISREPIPAKLVYVPTPSGVRLAWNVTIDRDERAPLVERQCRRLDRRSALEGRLRRQRVLQRLRPAEGEPGSTAAAASWPIPADPLASPFGWHDTNGVAGAESTLTIGNNVHAATDLDHNNLPDPGSEPDGGAGLLFDFPLDLDAGSRPTYRPAAVTNLFFWNNYMHDVSYHYGFTEAAGNFQENNYGTRRPRRRLGQRRRAGRQRARTTRTSARRPTARRRACRCSSGHGIDCATLTVNAPPAIAGDYAASAGLRTRGTTSSPATSRSRPGRAPAATRADFTGFPAGDIALVDRGTCTFSTKIRNAQDAGASAVIVANNSPASAVRDASGPDAEASRRSRR